MPFPSDGIKSRTIRTFEQLTEIEFQFDFLILNVPLTPKFNTRIAINRWINFIDFDIVTLAKEGIFNSLSTSSLSFFKDETRASSLQFDSMLVPFDLLFKQSERTEGEHR